MTQKGFTLIELMIVIAIISIFATMALPNFQDRIIQTQIRESFQITESLKASVEAYYRLHKKFPLDNKTAAIPLPEHLIGNYVKRVTLKEGALHILLGNRINAQIKGQTLSIRPVVVSENPSSPIAWICGDAEAVDGMQSIGENETSIIPQYLPIQCRSWKF